MDYKAIISLMKEMNETSLTKLEIETEGLKISLEKGATLPEGAFVPQVSIPASYYTAPMINTQSEAIANPSTSNTQATSGHVQEATPQNIPAEQCLKKLDSPMVGTFYSAASPEKPPFIKVGDQVKKGQTICIIEAMKLMNEIESEYDGEVVEILVKNEDMVEFGQPLFLVK